MVRLSVGHIYDHMTNHNVLLHVNMLTIQVLVSVECILRFR